MLDLACGIGVSFPLIEAAVGPGGRLIGFDYTPAMLDQARAQVEAHGWENVVLMQGDAAKLSLPEPVDAV
ncbi:MAG: class I SAM-dependent methyltransferase [Anaerolineae bacterium]